MDGHDGYTTSTFVGDEHAAGCSCGWKGPERQHEDEAEADLKAHYEDAANSQVAS